MKKFTRTKENFICENCGHDMIGNGYTNHCSKCFYSKHVDINPGDRLNDCGGLMKPIDFIKKGNSFLIVHKCLKCAFVKNNKIQKEDDFDSLLKLLQK
jgi:hypothetical protein